jgi:hypothetical protein
MKKPKCETCEYQDSNKNCRRRAPVLFRASDGDVYDWFPHGEDNEWCGDHPDFPAYLENKPIKIDLSVLDCGSQDDGGIPSLQFRSVSKHPSALCPCDKCEDAEAEAREAAEEQRQIIDDGQETDDV